MGFSLEIKISKTLVHFLDKLQQRISEWGERPGLQENKVTFWNSQLFSWGCDHFLIIFLEESFCIVPDFYSPVSVRNIDIKTTVQASQLTHNKLGTEWGHECREQPAHLEAPVWCLCSRLWLGSSHLGCDGTVRRYLFFSPSVEEA